MLFTTISDGAFPAETTKSRDGAPSSSPAILPTAAWSIAEIRVVALAPDTFSFVTAKQNTRFRSELLISARDVADWVGDVSHAPGPEKGNDVPPETAHIGCNGCFLFGATAFAENEPGFHICDVLLAKLLDGERFTFFFTFFRRITAMRCPPE